MYPEMVRIARGQEADFSDFRFGRDDITSRIRAFQFTNQRGITR